jgi:hypothetical protein
MVLDVKRTCCLSDIIKLLLFYIARLFASNENGRSIPLFEEQRVSLLPVALFTLPCQVRNGILINFFKILLILDKMRCTTPSTQKL